MKASTFVPAHISGFFQPFFQDRPERTGSRNCGPCLDMGVITEVKAEPSDRNSVRITIDGKLAAGAPTTREVVKQILSMVEGAYKIRIDHRCEIPVGSGYGCSGAGALGAAWALSRALELRLSKQRLITVAHVAEVESYTGLGDVGAQASGGLVIGVEPGAPPYGRWRRMEVPRGIKVICATLGQIRTKEILRNEEFRRRAKDLGGKAIKVVLKDPAIERFISASRSFAEGLGLFDGELKELADEAEEAGAVGASQSMLGRSVFALVPTKKSKSVRDALSQLLGPDKIFSANIHDKPINFPASVAV